MISRPAIRRWGDAGGVPAISDKPLQIFPPDRHSELVRRRGGLLTVPGRLKPPEKSGSQKLTKLLLNVMIERSLGPVHVVTSPENTVRDLVKAALEIYVKEKRRPLLTETDPRCFELHYSQFSLESLKPDDKLINLGSRNFFLCPMPTNSIPSSCSEEAIKSPFPWIKFMDFLL
ncbi:hypothetical protein L1049_007111 [Liquidambar formosana]|uniref:DUF7054 domain-containing protein n=1 Tax=Liquidambar formosana TaxID=63359 RepID=A0AAP0RGN7_LIQFO